MRQFRRFSRNRANIGLITRKIFMCGIECCYQNTKKIEKIHMDAEKSINSFEIKKG